jgi:hypothetical protein
MPPMRYNPSDQLQLWALAANGCSERSRNLNSSDHQKSSDMKIGSMHDGGMYETIHHPPRSAAELNSLNALVWSQRSEWFEAKLNDEDLCLIAYDDLASEWNEKLSFHDRLSFEGALARAEAKIVSVRRAIGRRGGKAERTDPLQNVILEAVREQPTIQYSELLNLLRKLPAKGHAVVCQVDQKSSLLVDQKEQIHFMDGGRIATAPVSGLKDRLSRARKKIRSR